MADELNPPAIVRKAMDEAAKAVRAAATYLDGSEARTLEGHVKLGQTLSVLKKTRQECDTPQTLPEIVEEAKTLTRGRITTKRSLQRYIQLSDNWPTIREKMTEDQLRTVGLVSALSMLHKVGGDDEEAPAPAPADATLTASAEEAQAQQEAQQEEGEKRSRPTKGICPVCKKEILVGLKDGKLFNHFVKGEDGKTVKCDGSGSFPVVVENDQGDEDEDDEEDYDQGDEWIADASGSSWKRTPYEVLKVPGIEEEDSGIYCLYRIDDKREDAKKLGKFSTLQEAQEAADKDLEENPYTPPKKEKPPKPPVFKRPLQDWKDEEIEAKLIRPGEDPEKKGRTTLDVSLPLLTELAARCEVRLPKDTITLGKFMRRILKVELIGWDDATPSKD